MTHPLIKNPHLNGDPFKFFGGTIGVLLVHGLKATPAEMRPLGEFLYGKGFTVFGPLLPGHNTSPGDVNNYTWKSWVVSVEAAYAELARQCESIFIGGESLGALLAIYLAPYHPEIVGILAYAPALKLKMRKIDTFLLYLLAPFIPYLPEKDSGDDLPWRGYQAIPLKGVIELLKLQHQVTPCLEHIRRPILIIQGKLDARVPPDVPEIIHDHVSSVLKEVHWMEKSTHCVVLDKESDSVQEITYRFITKSLGYTNEQPV